MNKLNRTQRTAIVGCLVEGMSIRSTSRITNVSIPTVLKLLTDLGPVVEAYQRRTLRNLTCKRIECDEIWSFVGMKQKRVPEEQRGTLGIGDVWTWTAIDAETKLIPTWLVGLRDLGTATEFIADLADRLSHRVQLTTDGHKSYLQAVDDAFGTKIDYAMPIKMYEGERPNEARYSPAHCTGIEKKKICGHPDEKKISTSYVERQNLTMRMGMRRFTRLTNAFSKKIQNHACAVALYFMHYNFARIHKTLRVTPAMAAGVADHVWDVAEIIDLLEAEEAASAALAPRKQT